jgi:hypothetical protein
MAAGTHLLGKYGGRRKQQQQGEDALPEKFHGEFCLADAAMPHVT